MLTITKMEEIITHHLSSSTFVPALPKPHLLKLSLPPSQNAPPPPRPRPLFSSLRHPLTFTQKPPKSPETPLFSEKLLYLDSIGLDHLSLISSHPPIISAPFSDLKSTVKLLYSLGLTALDLRRAAGMCPQILTATPQALTSVITFLLREAGVSGRDLRHVIHRRPRLLVSDVAAQLRPTLYFLQMLGITEISRHSYLLSCSVEEKLIPRIEFFENAGFNAREARLMLRRFPQLFCYGIEGNLEVKLGFLVGEMGRELREAKEFPQYFSFSLEKRIKRRHLICKERGVRFALPAMLKPSDEEFRERVEVCVGSTPPLRNSPLWKKMYIRNMTLVPFDNQKSLEESNSGEPASLELSESVLPLLLEPEPIHHPKPKFRYEDSLSDFFLPYINNVGDVKSDGNCGFRVIADSLSVREDHWSQVRKDLLFELDGNITGT